jgi:hypothetical protein
MRQFAAFFCCLLLAFPSGATTNLNGRTFAGARGGIAIAANVIVTPGATAFGSWAATAQPANQGSSGDYGYNDNAIGVWDAVPFQTYSSDFSLCVAAYHAPTAAQYASGTINNIAKVSFAINGGSFVDVTSMTFNAASGVMEYCALVRPSDFAAAGQFEARAIIYPTTGVPLVLQGTALPGALTTSPSITSYVANANFQGTLPALQTYVATTGTDSGNCQSAASPCLTISYAKEQINTAQASDIGGGVINLSAGTYPLGAAVENFTRNAATQWITVQAKSGVSPSAVTLNTTGGGASLRVKKLHLRNLTVSIPAGLTTPSGDSAALWLDGVTIAGTNKGLYQIYGLTSWQNGGIYVTGSTANNVQNGFILANLVSGSTITNVSGDAFSRTLAVIGSQVTYQGEYYTSPGAGVTNTGTLASGSPIITSVVDTSQFVVGAPIGSINNIDIPAGVTITGINVDGANTLHMSGNAGINSTAYALGTGSHADSYQSSAAFLTVTSSSIGSNTITISSANIYARVGNLVKATGIPVGTMITGVTGGGTTLTLSQNVTGALTIVTAYQSNIMIYGLTANYNIIAQGLFSDFQTPSKDIAIVNSSFGNQTPGMVPNASGLYIMQYASTATNINIVNTTFNGPTIWRTDGQFVPTDFTLVNATCVSGQITNHTLSGVTYYGGTC